MTKGNTPRPIRFTNNIWEAAVAAFPSERGKPGGLSAEVQSFVAFLAKDPDIWRQIKADAASKDVEPWQLVAEAVREHVS